MEVSVEVRWWKDSRKHGIRGLEESGPEDDENGENGYQNVKRNQ